MSITKKCDSGVFFKADEMRNCTAGIERTEAGTIDVKHEIFVMKFVLGGFGERTGEEDVKLC